MKYLRFFRFIVLPFFIWQTMLATEVTPRNVEELTGLAKRLFYGRCISVSEIFLPDAISYTEYTFEVISTLKGNMGKTVTFRQYGLLHPVKLPDNTIFLGNVTGMPVYKEGQEYLLFLLADSRLGLTSPAGLFQGSFKILKNYHSEKFAVNSVNNSGLLRGVPPAKKALLKKTSRTSMANGALELHDFMQLIRTYIDK